MPYRIAISAGELSGDEHASHVVKAFSALHPDAEYKGMGGRNLRSAGVQTVVDSESSASVMGFLEVVFSLKQILASMQAMRKLLFSWKPDLLILIDYPDFNLRLAKYAKRLNIPVVYYSPPQLWAWRSGRAKLIKKVTDTLVVIFPFENDFYRSKGLTNSVYVGHPFAGSEKSSRYDRESFLRGIGLSPDKPVVCILPGSRKSEIERHLQPVLAALEILKEKNPDIQSIIPLAPTLDTENLMINIPENINLKLVKGNSVNALRSADAGLLKSGTSNLQAAYAGLPFTMFYKTGLLAELIVKSVVRVKEYSIVNVIRPGTVKEVLQKEATPETLASELEDLLVNQKRRKLLTKNLAEVAESLSSYDPLEIFDGCNNTAERVAKLIESRIEVSTKKNFQHSSSNF